MTASLLAAPALLTGSFVYLYGVDVPYWDQWDGVCPLFEKMEAGTLGLGDFFAQHNEHRIFFPRLIMFELARVTHWNVRYELLVIWLLACVCAFNLWRLARATGWGRLRAGTWLLLGANWLLFSPLQVETWLWGMAIVFLLPLACFTASLWVAKAARYPLNFLATMALCTAATFSAASGFTSWLLVAPLLLWQNGKIEWRSRRGWWWLWLGGFVITVLVYFYGYRRPARHPAMTECLNHPIQAVQYVCAYLGRVFAQGTVFDTAAVAQAAGAALILILGVVVVYLWRWRRDSALVSEALPWLLLSLEALVNAVLAMVGRLGMGIVQALSTRYIIFSVMLPVGLLFLVPLAYKHWRRTTSAVERTGAVGMALASMATVFCMLSVPPSLKELGRWNVAQHVRLTTKALVLSINVVDEPELLGRYVHGIFQPLKKQANFLNGLGYLRPGLIGSGDIRKIADTTLPSEAMPGQIEQAGKAGEGRFGIGGWAILPDKLRVADAVLLTYNEASGEPTIFGLAEVGLPRREVAAAFQQSDYQGCGWSKTFSADQLPPGAGLLRAWAFDAETGRAYPLKGTANCQR